MLRVVHIISGLEVGGAEMALLRLAKSFAADSQTQHVVVALSAKGGMRARFTEAAIPLHVIDFKRQPIRNFIALIGLLRDLQPNIVQTWLYHADLIGGFASLFARRPKLIWGIRTTDVTAGNSLGIRLIRRVCSLLSYGLPHHIVCVAHAALRVHQRVGYSAKRLLVIPNGFDANLYKDAQNLGLQLRRELSIADHLMVVGSLGRFSPVKDHRNFIDAALQLAPAYPHLRFLLVGRGVSVSNPEFMALLSDSGYLDRFILLGERSDVATCLGAMDIFCLHSKTEGFPNVLAEAMLAKLPCVTTDVGDAARLVGDAGIVVPSESSSALASGLKAMLDCDRQTRDEMASLGYKQVHATYTLDAIRSAYRDLYANVA